VKWLVLLLGIAANASASVLVKVFVTQLGASGGSRPVLWLATRPALLAGVAMYAAAFVLYAVALRMLPLNVAHPILTCGAIAAVALLSVTVFGEAMPATTVLGLALIMAGVALVGARA
jgi:multidrug transporter EmrE-like cation transporter